ncbi:signaling mucin HKR1-like [Contarinia nasturtii]|uniref:signaling mucin HKR1-like n=1 Tax=Contarinia nasturtii TaxID=265458 RepID=UPI0012D3E387|nr:signaling mucin HKR1-like [Contarinia nasturtii]
MMFTKQIILFASIFAVICASKEQSNDGGFVTAESNHMYSQPIQDNIAAESEVAKRGAAIATSSISTSNENQGQSSQIDVGTNSGSGSGGVISFTTPNSFQQFFSPTFGQFGAIYAASLTPSASGNSPQIFYVRAPSQYVAPSGVGTIKLSYTSNQAQPQTSIQYASTTPKVAYAITPNQYQLAVAATQPNSYTYAPLAIASPYTTGAYTNANGYLNTATSAATNIAQLPPAALQQGQIIPYTASSSNGYILSQSQLQQLQQLGIPVGPPYTTPAPVAPSQPSVPSVPSVPTVPSAPSVKPGTAVVSPTPSAYYSGYSAIPASQAYQQAPTFLSYQNAGLNYATAQKLVAVPSYTQAAYRPYVSPTAATAATAYTNAYVQPTGISPVKYTLAQPTNYYSSAYVPKVAYAPSLSATSSTPFVTSFQQGQASQAFPSAQATNTNGAIQYASQIYQPSLTGTKYGYPTAQKYFYASS